MLGVAVAVEERDHDGGDALLGELRGGRAHPVLVEGCDDLTGGVDALAHDLAVPAPDERLVLPGDLLPDRVVQRPLVAGDVQDVAEPGGGDQAGHGAVPLEQGVGGDRGAVGQEVEMRVPDGGRHPVDQSDRVVVRSARDLVDGDLTAGGVESDDVGVGTAHVDAGDPHARVPSR